MNFKQLAVCLPAVLKDQRFLKKGKQYRLIEEICIHLHSFCFMLICFFLLVVHLQSLSFLFPFPCCLHFGAKFSSFFLIFF